MSTISRLKNSETELIEKTLKPGFPNVEAYRYNSVSIRIRVIDDRFKGKSKPERDDMVSPLLDHLPEEIQADITILLLLTNDELAQSLMNLEFEHPTRSSI